MKKRERVILACILLIATVLRFYRLDSLPPSLEWDEVATGYDAYSILKTGRDQFGNLLPLTFRSLDDYKPPLYTYLTSLSIAVLGWNDFAVRFPAALLGVLAVLTTFGMTLALFKNNKIALLTALLLSVAPWHVNFSRLALETNSTIFFTTAGVWAFLKSFQKGQWLIVSVILLGLNLYLYHNTRIFIPLLGAVILILYSKELLRNKKYTILASVVGMIFILRLIPIATSVEGQMRFQGTSIFSEAEPIPITTRKAVYRQWQLDDSDIGMGIIGKFFHSRYFFWGSQLFKNYLSHFDPNFLIFTNDKPRHHAQDTGLIYFIELPLLYIGTYFLLKNYHRRKTLLIIAWVIFAPVASSVTLDVPHALRSELFLPIFQIIFAIGLVNMFKKYSVNIAARTLFSGFVTGAYLLLITFFLHQYFIHFAKDTSKHWQYGREEAALYTKNIKDEYDRVIVDTRLDQVYIFFLYYLKYDPVAYLTEGGTVSGGWAEERNKFDKYEFHRFHKDQVNQGEKVLVVVPAGEETDLKVLHKIYYLDGDPAIVIGEIKKT